jgi:transposase
MTSGLEARGRFGKQDFVYLGDEDVYRCPQGEIHCRKIVKDFTAVSFLACYSCYSQAFRAQPRRKRKA